MARVMCCNAVDANGANANSLDTSIERGSLVVTTFLLLFRLAID